MPDRDTHCLPGTFRPGHVVLEAGSHVVVVRWQPVVKGDGRRRTVVEGAGVVNALSVLVQNLVVSTGGVGRGEGRARRMKLGEGRVVN